MSTFFMLNHLDFVLTMLRMFLPFWSSMFFFNNQRRHAALGHKSPVQQNRTRLPLMVASLLSFDRFNHRVPLISKEPTNSAPLMGELNLLVADCRQSRFLSLRTSDRRHWCGNPYSLKTACLLTFLPENGSLRPRRPDGLLGMTRFELCLHIKKSPIQNGSETSACRQSTHRECESTFYGYFVMVE